MGLWTMMLTPCHPMMMTMPTPHPVMILIQHPIPYKQLAQWSGPFEDQVSVELTSKSLLPRATPVGGSKKGDSPSNSKTCNSCAMCAQGRILCTICLNDFMRCAWYGSIPYQMYLLSRQCNRSSITSWLSPTIKICPSTRSQRQPGRQC